MVSEAPPDHKTSPIGYTLVWCRFWFDFRNLTRPQNQPNRIYNWLGLVWLWFWFGSEAPPDHETNPIGYYNIGSVLVWFQKPHQTTKPAQSLYNWFGLVVVWVRFGFRSLIRPRNQPNRMYDESDLGQIELNLRPQPPIRPRNQPDRMYIASAWGQLRSI